MGPYDDDRPRKDALPDDDLGRERMRTAPVPAAPTTPDVVNIEVGSLEITGTPEDRYALSETIYHLPLKSRGIIMIVIAALAILSAFVLAPVFSNPDTYYGIIETLDAKRANVLGLTAASTSASTGISFIPGDAGSAVADRLSDLSLGFLIILVAILLEKYALTIIGFILFAIIVPVCCGLYIAALALNVYTVTRQAFAHLATKLLLMGIAFFLLVPTSVGISNMIDATYEESIAQTIEQAEAAAQQAELEAQAEGGTTADQASQDQATVEPTAQEEGNWFTDLVQGAQDMVGGVADSVTGAFTDATVWLQDTLNSFLEIVAVMLVTSCIVPILVLILFLYIVKAIFNVDVSKPMQMLDPRTYRKAKATATAKSERG